MKHKLKKSMITLTGYIKKITRDCIYLTLADGSTVDIDMVDNAPTGLSTGDPVICE